MPYTYCNRGSFVTHDSISPFASENRASALLAPLPNTQRPAHNTYFIQRSALQILLTLLSLRDMKNRPRLILRPTV